MMHWPYAVSYFFGGAFLGNALPHIGNGISGRPFQSPFAKPPGQGLSSSLVNVLWGFFNLALAWVLIFAVGAFDIRNPLHAGLVGIGMLTLAVMMARHFGQFHGGRLK